MIPTHLSRNNDKNPEFGEKWLNRVSPVIAILAILSFILYYGFYLTPNQLIFVQALDVIIAIYFVFTYFLRLVQSYLKILFIRKRIFETTLIVLLLSLSAMELLLNFNLVELSLVRNITHQLIKIYLIILQSFIASNALLALVKMRNKWLFISIKPTQVLIMSFAFLILIGMFLLKLPRATRMDLSWIDALFLSTSAVCVTGLSPLNIVEIFTVKGQIIILILIQLGGLGIIILTSFIGLFITGKVSFGEQMVIMELLDEESISSLGQVLKKIIKYTLVFEIIGTALLFIFWTRQSFSIPERFFQALFHSVSAYCNAGFSILKDGLAESGFHNNYPVLIIVMLLIILGGIGFYTINEVWDKKSKIFHSFSSFSLQSRLVILSYATLIVSGAILIYLFEADSWKDLPMGQGIINALFTSVTARTAGFANINMSNLHLASALIVILLMYIGGAPNGTAGGIKVTTLVTLISGFVAFTRGREQVEIHWNTIPMIVMRRAYIVFITSITVIFLAILVLAASDPLPFFDLMFECFSALGTVGLSRGITPNLSATGKIVITFLMFFGRVGLFTFAVAFGRSRRHLDYKYPEANIIVG